MPRSRAPPPPLLLPLLAQGLAGARSAEGTAAGSGVSTRSVNGTDGLSGNATAGNATNSSQWWEEDWFKSAEGVLDDATNVREGEGWRG